MNNSSNNKAIIKGENYRFTVLTPELIRMEYQADGIFEDGATQRVINRNFEVPQYQVKESAERLDIFTESLHLVYYKGEFSPSNLSVTVHGNGCKSSKWTYGDPITTLGGTARTLDGVDGAISLEAGLLSKEGFSVVDDSESVVMLDNGWIRPRGVLCKDLYFFGYGHAYQKCLRDFYHLTGAVPLVPRYVLGNWWSRYYPYTEQTYKELVSKFEAEEIPLSVAVIDMDWHLTEVDPKYGTGYTGYTWNPALFPDYKAFLGWLHEHNLKVSLNIHPADGIRAFEKQYKQMAIELGVDWENEETIEFDLTNPAFVQAYFKHICYPYEDEGVDFWWNDWQQGKITRIPGLDPLWMLNHYSYLASKHGGKRALTFSRYAGIGSHRYPIGFSGDSIISWESLDFQPFFTATASNVGYGWWSHDIGGHMCGYRDEELSARWVQFGVFSPIMRLHSSKNPYLHKEPWTFTSATRETITRYMRLRHELIPYLYTMNVLAAEEGQPLVRPMYYLHAEDDEAYNVPNEYYFGTEMIVCPITEKSDETGLACVDAWLPEGTWFDIFNKRIYRGGHRLSLVRQIDNIPVLAKAGAIVPYADLVPGENGVENPTSLHIQVFAGNNGTFVMREDSYDNEQWANTRFTWDWDNGVFTIHAVEGCASSIPDCRSWCIEFIGICKNASVEAYSEGAPIPVVSSYDPTASVLSVKISSISTSNGISIRSNANSELVENNHLSQISELFTHVNATKHEEMWKIDRMIRAGATANQILSQTMHADLPDRVKKALWEIILA